MPEITLDLREKYLVGTAGLIRLKPIANASLALI